MGVGVHFVRHRRSARAVFTATVSRPGQSPASSYHVNERCRLAFCLFSLYFQIALNKEFSDLLHHYANYTTLCELFLRHGGQWDARHVQIFTEVSELVAKVR